MHLPTERGKGINMKIILFFIFIEILLLAMSSFAEAQVFENRVFEKAYSLQQAFEIAIKNNP